MIPDTTLATLPCVIGIVCTLIFDQRVPPAW